MIHELKIYPKYFELLANGTKTFEVRKDDRGFNENDILILKEWDPDKEVYTGREIECLVPYVSRMSFFDVEEFVVMSVKLAAVRL